MSRVRGQNPRVTCLHMRRSRLCRQPDPPMLPTGSAFRLFTSLPERYLNATTHVTRRRAGHDTLDCRVVDAVTRSPEICCIPMETRPTYCCCFLFRAGSPQDIWSRSGPGFGVLLTFRLCVLLRRDCLPRSDCVIHLLLLHKQLTVSRMILWWNLLVVGALP